MEKLQPNCSYHIFNHANGFENIFTVDDNYRFYLDKYQQYILPIAKHTRIACCRIIFIWWSGFGAKKL